MFGCRRFLSDRGLVVLARTYSIRWLYYSLICVICWGGWVLCSKLGSVEIPERDMQFLFGLGTLPVALVLWAQKSVRQERSLRGVLFGLLNGILSGIGSIALFAAYRAGGNTAVVTTASAAYPAVTVILAIWLLKEHLSWVQGAGIALAVVAAVLFSI